MRSEFMEVLSVIVNITMIALIVRAIFTISGSFILAKKVKKAQQKQVDLNEINEKIKEQNHQLQEHLQSLMVKDDYCGKMINKEKAFIVSVDDQRHHFCSWDCRQKYFAESA